MMLGYEEIALCNTGGIVAMMMRMSFVGAMVVVAIFYSGAYHRDDGEVLLATIAIILLLATQASLLGFCSSY